MCDRYVKFAGATTLCLVAVAELSLILRVHAIYLGNKYILMFLLPLLLLQVVFSGYGVSHGMRVPLPDGFPGCVLTGRDQWIAALWAAPLLTDTCIFILTILRTIRYRRQNIHMTTMQVILRDGTIYFALIFSANLMNTLIYFLAVEDLKAMGASFSQILTAIMISRLQLNLRRAGTFQLDSNKAAIAPIRFQPNDSDRQKYEKAETTTFFSVGNLGGELHGTFFEDALYGEDTTLADSTQVYLDDVELDDVHGHRPQAINHGEFVKV